MPPKFATETKVGTDQSRLEIEKVLKKYGATAFGYLSRPESATILFEIQGRRVRFILPLPDPSLAEFTRYQRGGYSYPRTESEAAKRWEQACRQSWRALLLVIKANLEAVEVGIMKLEDVFLPFTVLPNNQTIAEWYEPQVEQVYQSGQMSELLPGVTPLALPAGKGRRGGT